MPVILSSPFLPFPSSSLPSRFLPSSRLLLPPPTASFPPFCPRSPLLVAQSVVRAAHVFMMISYHIISCYARMDACMLLNQTSSRFLRCTSQLFSSVM